MELNEYNKINLSAIKGAYSIVTERENYDSQITLTGYEAELVITFFGEENIHVGKVGDDKEASQKSFLLYPDMNEIHLNLVFPKPNKTELRLYLATRSGFKPKAGSIFFIYLSSESKLVIGSCSESEWELISNERMDVEPESEDGNTYMERPFDPGKINIETKTPSLDTLIKRVARNQIQMDTESYFQRKDDLWDETKQSRLIESILIRFPLPAFFFDASDDNSWLVVDGLQRLSSIRNFCVRKTLRLRNLEFLEKLNGNNYDDLSSDMQRLIEEAQVVIYKIMPGTPTDVKFNIFKRINTGGLVLEPQEIRHALFQGIPSQFVAELARIDSFKIATLGRIKTDRMLDRDFANRFLAFYLLGYNAYQSDLDTFMSQAMAQVNNKTIEQRDNIKEDFSESMILARDIFGDYAFRKYNRERLTPINKAIFEVLSSQFALLSKSERNALREKSKDFEDGFNDILLHNDTFIRAISSSTGDRTRVSDRHTIVEKLVHNFINATYD